MPAPAGERKTIGKISTQRIMTSSIVRQKALNSLKAAYKAYLESDSKEVISSLVDYSLNFLSKITEKEVATRQLLGKCGQ